jgi:N-acyl-L-homoserine lactone synthetase
MVYPAFADAIRFASDEMLVEVAQTSLQVTEAQRLRYKVYCEERSFEPGADGLEQDPYDVHSRHVIVRSKNNGAIYGTVRIVLSNATGGQDSYPMSRICEPHVLAPLPVSATGEISRFALTRDRQGISAAASALMRLFLMRGIVAVSGAHCLTHWCAIMETSLLRLLRATAIHFEAVGPTVEFHGTRQPAVGGIATVLGRIRLEQPLVWGFITDDGQLWKEDQAPVRRFG